MVPGVTVGALAPAESDTTRTASRRLSAPLRPW